ncbi:hypothetical protein M2G59_21225 [Vibrio vulnificus]|uniref:hypothetical protein n=1 Tax=Vibrio vulnificus TaxID=672 RepID=UPI00092C5646|nr:hypothetical protein [Vibrio vulnificus]EGR0237937.1 hypothetical protein [Vibrio vulnificus]EJE8694999.1 hypothetical protein [Vibrio vulnificus]ELF4909370.1 hypothetical protein [Vibrio vulnificus]ELF6258975.1 hypothetical protein [Vibrio vulnificus]ELG9630609.1 hypothetical protein [Vibrio vulnificus]
MKILNLCDFKVGEMSKFMDLCDIIACILNECSDNSLTNCVVLKIIREASLLATECRMLNGKNKNNAAFISPKALAIKEEGRELKNLTLEHGVPVSVIRDEVLKLVKPSALDVASVIYQLTALAVITNEEDSRINKLGLRSKMPPNWNGNKWIRYQLANIDLIDNPYKK